MENQWEDKREEPLRRKGGGEERGIEAKRRD